MAKSYEDSGVSLEAGYESVRRIKSHIERTNRPGVMGGIGGFGGMFDLASLNIKDPILVSGTDGVGTKLKIAFALDKHDTIGQDVVAMCVNDVLAQGAQPLFFLDYVAVGKNDPAQIEQIVKGVADGCQLANCALIGGETAEMPDMYQLGEYDIAGFTVGVVERAKLIDGSKVKLGDLIIGLPSSGVHSNGFSLVRKIVQKDHQLDLNQYHSELNGKLGEVLLTPTRIYVQPVVKLLKQVDVHAIAHITGGGFDENIPRVLPEGLGVVIEEKSWNKPPIFDFLEKMGGLDHREMFNVFNMGIGMILVIDSKDKEQTISLLQESGEKPVIIGKITDQPFINLILNE